MPRPKKSLPAYLHHKPSGQAYIRLTHGGSRRIVYLGKYDTPESRAEYRRLTAELETSGATTVAARTAGPNLTVKEVMLAYMEWATTHYLDPDGNPTQLALGAAYTATVLSLDAKDAAPIVSRQFIQSADAEVRIDAAHHLQWVGPLGAPHHEAIVPLLDDKDDKVMQVAATTIRYHAPKGSVADRALVTRRLVQDPSNFRFSKALAADPVATPPGIKSLTDGADDLRDAAAFNLGDLGADANAAVPTLKTLLTDSDPDLRLAARYALARIANDQPSLRQLLRVEIDA